MGWMKKGKESAALAEKEKVEAAKRKEEQGKLWRFWIKQGEETQITFVDGVLDDEGYLTPPRFYEHQILRNGNWNNYFVCPEHTMPEAGYKCPICASGDRASLVALFTVIDHSSYTAEDGKVYKDQVRILAAKPNSFELLNNIAIKRGGLAGATFDVSRIGDKAAAIGSHFDFVGKKEIEELRKQYAYDFTDPDTGEVIKRTKFTPAKYDEEIIFRTDEELLSFGFGKPTTGSQSGFSGNNSNASSETGNSGGGKKATNYDDVL